MKRMIFTLAAAMLLTGCSDEGNISGRAYLRAAAVEDSGITFCFYTADGMEADVVTVPLTDPKEAKKAAELAVGKEIFTGHGELILLGNCDKKAVLEYALHEWKLSPGCLTAACDGSGRKLLEETKGEMLKGMIEEAQKQGYAPKCDIVTVLGSLLNENEQTQIPRLSGRGYKENAYVS